MPVLAWTADCFAGSWSRLSSGIRVSLFLLPSQLLMAADSLTCNPSNCRASDAVAIFILLVQTMDYSRAIRESTNQKRDHFPKSVDSLNSGSQKFSGFLAYWHLNTVAFKSSILWIDWLISVRLCNCKQCSWVICEFLWCISAVNVEANIGQTYWFSFSALWPYVIRQDLFFFNNNNDYYYCWYYSFFNLHWGVILVLQMENLISIRTKTSARDSAVLFCLHTQNFKHKS